MMNIASVINDYESLCRFRSELLGIVDGLNEQLRKTEQAMDEVASVWKDSQFQKYHKEFAKDKEMISPLCTKLERYESEVLYRLEKKIERYLNTY